MLFIFQIIDGIGQGRSDGMKADGDNGYRSNNSSRKKKDLPGYVNSVSKIFQPFLHEVGGYRGCYCQR
ncbi:MAG: hypothetical protein IPL46_32415 [Saprospiraceae bacterium]|nr:hypothetical protein [Saprospiraceae bacterium]